MDGVWRDFSSEFYGRMLLVQVVDESLGFFFVARVNTENVINVSKPKSRFNGVGGEQC